MSLSLIYLKPFLSAIKHATFNSQEAMELGTDGPSTYQVSPQSKTSIYQGKFKGFLLKCQVANSFLLISRNLVHIEGGLMLWHKGFRSHVTSTFSTIRLFQGKFKGYRFLTCQFAYSFLLISHNSVELGGVMLCHEGLCPSSFTPIRDFDFFQKKFKDYNKFLSSVLI